MIECYDRKSWNLDNIEYKERKIVATKVHLHIALYKQNENCCDYLCSIIKLNLFYACENFVSVVESF